MKPRLILSLCALALSVQAAAAVPAGRGAAEHVLRDQVAIFWSDEGGPVAWRVNVARGEHQFRKVDPDTGEKSPAFDHEQLAEALRKASGRRANAQRLPLDFVQFSGDGQTLRFRAHDQRWRFDLTNGELTPDNTPPASVELQAPETAARGTRRNGDPVSLLVENATGGVIELFWVDRQGARRSYGQLANGESATQSTYAGHMWLFTDDQGRELAAVEAPDAPAIARVTGRVRGAAGRQRQRQHHSPDGRWSAVLCDHNIVIEARDGGESFALTTDGTRADAYRQPFFWSPDSTRLIAFRAREVSQREIHIVQSSPPDQLHPRLRTLQYNKPGDPILQPKPRLFDIGERKQVPVDDALFENPWALTRHAWEPDSSEFTFVFNERGHQVMRILGIGAATGEVRVIHEERSATFIDYSQKFHLTRLPDTGEMIWASERHGHNHLYLLNTAAGEITNPITQGEWNVREVLDVDEENRRLLLRVMGMPGQDPYHYHFARVNFDGTGFTRLTEADGTHRIELSPDGRLVVATWSRVDHPPVTELRAAETGALIAELERADASALTEAGIPAVERFTAKGRDGETDIHGIIIRPTDFDPDRSYPVVESIYAGPHGYFVPKQWSAWSGLRDMAEHGFVIVKIDGMGTNWRSKAFHDVAWKNLADSGLPDRVLWIKAAADDRPWMDLERVGIYGGSAGGQSTVAALLHHGDFYKVGVADCGCHDNRMDKIWWNEAWMGWPVDESYERNSNTTHAANLRGELMLIVGELDTNVDPASTAQVAHALQQAGRDFEYVVVINAGHGAAETPFGRMKRRNFLIRNLLPSASE